MISRQLKILIATVIFAVSHQVIAQEAKQAKAADPVQESKQMKLNDDEQAQKDQSALLDKYFGAGIMANIDLGGRNHRVKSARTIGGLVRVEEESRAQLGFILEAHKFTSRDSLNKKLVSGPYVGLVMGGEGLIETGILGWMWGFKQPSTLQTLNIGAGLSISPKAQVLGDGIIAGQALPNGETEVRFKKTTIYGLAITVSFGF